MRSLVAILLTAILAWLAGIWLPWWSVALAAAIVALIVPQAPGKAWLTGFLGILILWAVAALLVNLRNESVLAPKMAAILPLQGSVGLLIMITALTGALAGGMGALTVSLFLRFSKKN
ncbi:MAG TPA: hypothetical protein VK628_07550 [Flavitalea sp.]|nr:hypothetical protein [Flavitalea sp.]